MIFTFYNLFLLLECLCLDVKWKKVGNTLVSYICLKKIKNSYIVIINLVMIIKKRSGGEFVDVQKKMM